MIHLLVVQRGNDKQYYPLLSTMYKKTLIFRVLNLLKYADLISGNEKKGKETYIKRKKKKKKKRKWKKKLKVKEIKSTWKTEKP